MRNWSGEWEILHGRAHIVEALLCADASTVVFNFGHPIAGVVERLPAAVGGEDQLGPPIGRIRPSLEMGRNAGAVWSLADEVWV